MRRNRTCASGTNPYNVGRSWESCKRGDANLMSSAQSYGMFQSDPDEATSGPVGIGCPVTRAGKPFGRFQRTMSRIHMPSSRKCAKQNRYFTARNWIAGLS